MIEQKTINELFNFLLMVIGLPTIVLLFSFARHIRNADPSLYERNRKIALFCKKINREKNVTDQDLNYLRHLAEKGLVTRNSSGKYMISDKALDDMHFETTTIQ